MWTVLRIVAGVLLLVVYGWLLTRPRPSLRGTPSPWQRILFSGAVTALVAIALPLFALTLIFGLGLWAALIAGWIWVVGGGVLGLAGAFAWELIASRVSEHLREPLGRAIFWTFFVLGGLGLVLVALRLWLGGAGATAG
jgi:hypothetical protein